MKNSSPKVSVIVPVYNVEKYLEKCLDSLINQTLNNIEIIVVNDGSLDNSQKTIDKYVKKYPKLVKSFIKENGGQGSARNFGIDKSIGKYIMFVDSDDYIELDMVKKMYDKIEKEKADIIICGNNVIDENYKILRNENAKKFNDSAFNNALLGKMAIWNKIIKKELILKNKIEFRSKVWYEDLDFTMKCLICAKKIDFLPDYMYNYLLREGSTMNNSNVNRNLEIIDAFDDIIKYCKTNNIYNKYYEDLEILAIDHIFISSIVRIIRSNANKKEKKEIIGKLRKYFIFNFPNYKKNDKIKLLSSNRKILLKLINNKLYAMVSLIFIIKNRRK